ncbi:MAG TPA: glutamate synthase large subunit [Balneolales bacterium]|nr:glutamate synthase large subunit [Balneolales bacterium]
MKHVSKKVTKGLYKPQQEHSNCGVGIVVNLKGKQTHRLVEDGFRILENLDHRGARGAEEKTGDGAGMMLQKPHDFFKSIIPELGDFDSYGVGQVFFPRDYKKQMALKEVMQEAARKEKFNIICWRKVPTDNTGLGKTALHMEPAVFQFFVEPIKPVEPEKLDSKLYVLRRLMEKAVRQRALWSGDLFYICSLDRRKIVYKGLLTCAQLRSYYPELSNSMVKTGLVMVHSRFSTNTLGSWDLAHPYRVIVHNGEINTLQGNINWMKTREPHLASERFGEDIEKIKPITPDIEISDSAGFDHVLELLHEAGRDLPHALRMMVPEAWNKDAFMHPMRKSFYDYHSTLMEPWDGPALVAASDGFRVAAILDRNGLRPCRYVLTDEDKLVMASEDGVLDILNEQVVKRGRLKPGELFMADTIEKRIIPEEEIFDDLTDEKYGKWLDENRVRLPALMDKNDVKLEDEFDFDNISTYQRAFGFTLEYLNRFLKPMIEVPKDPIGAMGDDTPLPVFSTQDKPLFTYFKQAFAQVSNPPLDYIREQMVTSLESHIGSKHNLLSESPEHCRQLFVKSPILTDEEMEVVRDIDENGIRSCVIDITYPAGRKIRRVIELIRERAEEAILNGCEILILSDRTISPKRLAVPSLLVVGALHHHLIRKNLRTRAALVVESGEPSLVHHFCTLLGYGADAVNPWLAYRSITKLLREGNTSVTRKDAYLNYRKAVEGGILKVMSKMGISTLESYKGAQIFETIGLNADFVQEYFTGTTANLSGIGLRQIERGVIRRHEQAFNNRIAGTLPLKTGGDYYWRRDGEQHQWSPLTIGKLQYAVKVDDYDAYKEFAKDINDQNERQFTIRGILDFRKNDPIPLEEVEPEEEIMKRFSTGSMSFGSLSKETHETLATAMNRIGGKSGSGEGGEEVERFGTERECSMKQVASGRFGVTSEYLASAKQIEIKMAQGAKPGEGGELPGGKVGEVIAKVRYTIPGIGLISPPPHHDIYSIEDLAQLIHDLKCANPEADIHVKLVAKSGVGTIAAGVAKARADAVLISGDSGGTGAAVKTSIKSAGSLWELGLAEANQVLLATNLRSRIRVRTDGGLKTGRDVAVAALLGAEEYGFGTAALVTLGCIMLRKCHCNTCSVGIATQDPELRKRFTGKPEYVINYMKFIAREVREIMAEMGFRTMDEMIGRVDKLRPKELEKSKVPAFDLSALLYRQPSDDNRIKTKEQNHKLDRKIDHTVIEKVMPALEKKEPISLDINITNRDRTFGTLLSSAVTKKYGMRALEDDTVTINANGIAGQSFGAFLAKGITMRLNGAANDYVGKGLSGGKIIVKKPAESTFESSENIIIGNVTLYGATAGETYFNGQAGERFCVRNSGAMSVVEGIGDHGCEYMTGGTVVILGATGKNFGAGMSGGEAYIFDEEKDFESQMNKQQIHLESFEEERDKELVKRLLENHYAYTKSLKAKRILDNWEESVKHFVKVMPDAYARVFRESIEKGIDIRQELPPKHKESIVA